MVSFEEVQTAYYMIAATGVLVAAVYYVISMRNAEKARRREIIFRKLPVQDRYYYDALYTAMKMTDFKTPEEFAKKYGYWVNHDEWCKFMYIMNNYNLVGLLLMEKLANAEEIFFIYPPIPLISLYERFEFWILINRVSSSGEVADPDFFKPHEMLYREAKRRHPKLETMESSQEEAQEWLRRFRKQQQSKQPP